MGERDVRKTRPVPRSAAGAESALEPCSRETLSFLRPFCDTPWADMGRYNGLKPGEFLERFLLLRYGRTVSTAIR